MKKIVQLSEYEYDKLIASSNLNEEKIKELAIKRINDEERLPIELIIDIPNDFKREFKFTVRGYSSPTKATWMEYDEKRQIIEYIEERMRTWMYNRFDFIPNRLTFLQERINAYDKARSWFIGLTVSGWGIAIVIMLKTLLK
jgi:hypothetical protein